MKNNVHLGRVIRHLIQRNDDSISACAEKIEYSVQALYAIFEKEDVNTSLLKKLCVAYNIPLTYFFNSNMSRESKNRQSDQEKAINAIANTGNENMNLIILENENKSLREQNELLKEMLSMYKNGVNNGTNSGTK